MGRAGQRAPRALSAGLALAVLAVAACSGGDDDGDDVDAARSTTTSTSIVFTGDADSQFCGQLREVQVQGVLDETSSTPAEVEAAYTAVIEALGELVEVAPPELEEDTALVLAGMVTLDDALRAVGYQLDALTADPEAAVAVSRAANDPAFGVANSRIEAYKDQVCGL